MLPTSPGMRKMAKGADLTARYEGYAVYLPSLQQPYAQFATKKNKEVRDGDVPKGFRIPDLNFFDPESRLWSCGFALYSAGQFENASIHNRDIVAERDRTKGTVVGDSGGYQLGTGKITNKREKAALDRYVNSPEQQYANWHSTGFKERTLAWLDLYCDYSMTLDMVLWASEEHTGNKKSQLRKLSAQQLIQLSVDNLRYFSDHRGTNRGKGTKFLNVLQDVGNGSGDAWYDAVKDFEFEGWAFGSETRFLGNSLLWLRRLLDDKKLDRSEWIHVLQSSPPVMSVVYTAIQRSLIEVLGRDIRVSYDSSSPHQLAGKQRALVSKPVFTDKLKTWKMSSQRIWQNIQIAQRKVVLPLPEDSPLSKYIDMNDLVYHQGLYKHSRVDSLSEHLIANHNLYTYHAATLDACDLVFKEGIKDWSAVPGELQDFVALADEFFKSDKPDVLLQNYAGALKALSKSK